MDNFNYITKTDIGYVKEVVENFTEEDWNEFDFRQKTFEVHKETKTIPLIFDTDFRSSNPTYLPRANLFIDDIKRFSNLLKDFYGEGYLIRSILVSLKANSVIAPHIDKGDSLEKCFRVHLPIITNDKVNFIVGDEMKIFKEGELWEINNSGKIHSVENNSDVDRVHLILDWICYSI